MHNEVTRPLASQRIIAVLSYTVVGFIASFILFYNLGSHSISIRSDEVIYVRVTQGIVHSGDFLNLTHGSSPFFHKPPLKFAIGAIAPILFGESNLTYRIADALVGICVLILVAYLAFSMFKSHIVAVTACILTLSCLELSIGDHGFRRAALDSVLVLLTLLTGVMAWRIESKVVTTKLLMIHAVMSGLCVGGALLTKSIGGIVPLLCLAGGLLLSTERKQLKTILLVVIVAGLTALSVGALYYAPLMMGSPKAQSIILKGEILHRAFKGYSGHNTDDPFFYVRYLFTKSGAIPSGFLILTLLYLPLLRAKKQIRFLCVWGILPILLFSISAAKTPWYISPTVPFLSILGARCITYLPFNRDRYTRVIRIGALSVFTVLILWGLQQLNAKYTHIFKTVRTQTARLPFDLFVESVRNLNEPFHIFIHEGAISGGTNPKKGRFNVEGIYRQMLMPHITKVQDPGEKECGTPVCYVLTKSPLSPEFEGYSLLHTLPPFGARSHTVYVYKTRTK